MADIGLSTRADLASRSGSGRDGALQAALERLAPGQVRDRPDTPDLLVTALRRLPPVAAEYAPFPRAVDERLQHALESRGITQLYTHQAEAIDHALAGRNVVVVTPTASGKTLCYNAPTLSSILQDPSSRALYLFPTKALAQDQLAELQALCELLGDRTDTPVGVFTMAIRRRMPGGPSAHARTWSSAIPTWCTQASCRIIRDGPNCLKTSGT
jgi:ATP-dependent helicase YprA (DUF1998 family)